MNCSKPCPICGCILKESAANLVYSYMYRYSCEQPQCQLKPYTRYSALYINDTCNNFQIIIDINKKHYVLTWSSYRKSTEIGVLRHFLYTEQEDENSEYVRDKLCTLYDVEMCNDVISAHKLISRILNIKAFL